MSAAEPPATLGPGGAGASPRGRTLALITLAWIVSLAQNFGMEFLAQASIGRGTLDTAAHLLGVGLVHLPLWVLVTVAALRLSDRFPLRRGRLVRHGAILIAAGIALNLARLAVFLGFIRASGLMRTEIPFLYGLIHYTAQDLYIFIAIVLLAHSVRHAREVREREVAGARLESQLVQAQLQALKVQIQPHFLFNSLNAIAALVREDPRRAERTVEHLSEMLRTTLTHGRTQEVSVREEVRTLQPYLEIEKVRLGERLSVLVEVDPEAQAALMPHLLLQPLVENAIRHGVSPRRRPGHVRVSVGRQGSVLRLLIEDNGKGMDGPIRDGAIGLENTRSRLRQLYGEGHNFEIATAPEQGTRIAIDVPWRLATDAAPTLAGAV